MVQRAGDDSDGASPDATTTDRNNDDNDVAPSAADNAVSSSSRNPLLPPASHSAANNDDDRRRRLPRVLVVEERIRLGGGRGGGVRVADDPRRAALGGRVPRGALLPRVRGAWCMPVFRRLLEKAEEEFEFHYHGGAVTIPCDTKAFRYILVVVMDRHRQGLVDD
ncbi:LOW QUALITY PROTEIN: hypothetical protein SORBI_3010G072600, partial [Sorghum bicolor]